MNAPVTERTISNLNSAFRSSRAVREILRDALPYANGQVGVAGFLHNAADDFPSQLKDTSSTVAMELFKPRREQLVSATGLASRVVSQQVPVSPGLWQAFETARELREATGGKDGYLGLRHILFAIALKPSGPLAEEVATVEVALGDVPWRDFCEAIARYCIDFREPQERLSVWRNLLAPWGLGSIVPQDAPPPRDPEVALLQPDDAWSGEVNDCSGATQEAEAFANMVCATQFKPPLAVAIFGEWGSGKSFFMRLLYDAVDAVAKGRRSGPAEPDDVTFHEHVVQIRFNAWHYAETNLWASLVDNIFTSLSRWAEEKNNATAAHRLFERLTTAQGLTLDAAEELLNRRREQARAQRGLVKAQKALVTRRQQAEQAPQTHAKAAFDTVLGTPEAKAELDQAAEHLGLGALSTNAERFRAARNDLDRELAGLPAFQAGWLRSIAAPALVAAMTAGAIALPILAAWLTSWWQASGAVQATAIVAGLIAPVGAGLAFAARRTEQALAVVRRYRAAFDREVEAKSAQEAALVRAQETRLAATEAAARDAEERLKLANDRVAEAAQAYNEDSGRDRVLRFVRDRVAEGAYARQLGFVANIRRDFEELSRLMSAEPTRPIESEAARLAYQKRVEQIIRRAGRHFDAAERKKLRAAVPSAAAANARPAVVFERIVLYIDDLDRCPPEQVVAVLQAIHLLLTFPLFVVFVAVDVRWLRTSLRSQFPEQFGEDGESATPSDYLEKIFQIPYWVRPMPLEATRGVIEDRIGPEPRTPGAAGATPATAATGATASAASAGARAVAARGGDAPERRRAASLRLTADEWRFINALAAVLDGVPRRTLRFVNTYRIIKGSLDSEEAHRLETGGYRALIALLSIAIVADEHFPAIANSLAAGGKRIAIDDPTAAGRVRQALELAEPATTEDFAHYAALAARFSFHEGLAVAVA